MKLNEKHPRIARKSFQVISRIVLILCLFQTIIAFSNLFVFLRIPVLVVMIILVIMDVAILLIFYRCPKCGKLLNFSGEEQRICHHCGYRLTL